MKSLQAVAGVVVAVLMVYGQTVPSRAQESDTERLRQLEQELERMREELDIIRRDQINMPTLPKFPVKFGASITIRYDLTEVEDQEDIRLEDDEINGFRTRDRFSVTFEPDGPVHAGLRLTTGGDPNPTSPFIRMGDLFQSDSFQLDQFYINVRPVKFFDSRPFSEHPFQVALGLGKMPNPFWTGDRGAWRSEVVWDTDVQPEGIALKFGMPKLLPFLGFESTTGYFIIEEVDDFRFSGLTGDTYLVATQLKLNVFLASLAFTFYDYEKLNAGLRAPNFDPGSGAFVTTGESAILLRSGLQRTNNQINFGPGANGFVDDNFQVIDLAGQVYIPIPLPTLAPEVFFFGEYLNNLSVDEDEQGWSISVGLRGGGEGKILAPFNIWFTYRDVDEDATLATFADSDLGAGTGYKGFEAAASYQVHRHLLLQISGFSFDGSPNKDNHVRRIFFDVVANF